MPLKILKIEPQKSIAFYVKGKLQNSIYDNLQHKYKKFPTFANPPSSQPKISHYCRKWGHRLLSVVKREEMFLIKGNM
jgi:hypothetical protein